MPTKPSVYCVILKRRLKLKDPGVIIVAADEHELTRQAMVKLRGQPTLVVQDRCPRDDQIDYKYPYDSEKILRTDPDGVQEFVRFVDILVRQKT